jgi:glutamine amidotransferase
VTIALIDYGAGNLASVRKGLVAAGAEVVTPVSPAALHGCSAIVVPGVGHFAATAALHDGWRDAIRRRVEAGVPLLGICLGMQWLFEGSDEDPAIAGIGLLAGRCTRLTVERPLKVPHVGWNTLTVSGSSAILEGVESGTHVYFTHSFIAPVGPACAASSRHGDSFAAAVESGHVAGVQFHPEKSGEAGIRILRNFVAMTRR